MKNSYFFTALKITLSLFLVCGVIAGAVALAYSVTIKKYEKNVADEKSNAIAEIFREPGAEAPELTLDGVDLPEKSPKSVKEVSKVLVDEKTVIGYAINITGKGFGGEISLMIGYNADGSIRGVKIISHAETPGVGTKATTNEHLSQYNQKSGELTISKKKGDDIAAVSGATISSKAIHAAVNEANKLIIKVINEGGSAQ